MEARVLNNVELGQPEAGPSGTDNLGVDRPNADGIAEACPGPQHQNPDNYQGSGIAHLPAFERVNRKRTTTVLAMVIVM